MKNKYTRKVLLSLGMGLLGSIAANAQQKIGNNPGTLNPGAILELESTNRGFLLPRISLTSLSTWGLNGEGTDGMMVFNTNATTGAGYYVWSGGAWNRIFTGTVDAVTTNALAYNTTTRILTSTVNGVGASTAALPLAASGATGLLSNTDWTTFNGKQNALTVSNGLTLTGSALTLGGALTAPTTLTLGTQSLTFNASGTAQVIIQGPAGNTAGLRLSNLTGAGTAGTSGQKVLSVNASGDVVLVTDFGTANAGTVTNVTGTAPITVTNGSTTPVIGINQAALDLALMGGILPVTKLAAGTTGQTLQMVGTTPTWVTPSVTNTSNIYTENGTLSGKRTVALGSNDLNFSMTGTSSPLTLDNGHTGRNPRISTQDSLEFQSGINNHQLTLLPNGNIGVNTSSPTIDFDINSDFTGNSGFGIRSKVGSWDHIYFNHDGSAASFIAGGAESGLRFRVGTSSSGTYGDVSQNYNTAMTIMPTGLIGIGTVTPSQRLHVVGGALISSLAGTGSRMVVADANGVLSTQAVPVASVTGAANGLSLVTGNVELGGSLTKATTLTLGTNALTFNASSTGQVIVQGPAGNTAGLRLSNLTGAGTAGTSGQKVLSVNASGDVVLVTDFGTANAGTVTNVTGTAPITVTNGSTTPVIGVNQAALDLALMGGILPVTKLAAGTTGQTLQMVGTTPTWVTPTAATAENIYTANGTLTGSRSVNMATHILRFVNDKGSTLSFAKGHTVGTDNYRIITSDTLEFQVVDAPNLLTLIGKGAIHPNGAVFIGSNGTEVTQKAEPTSTLDVNGSVSFAIRKITQTGATRALGLAAAARTVGATDRTVLVNTSVNPEGIEIILPNPVLASGREYIIRKMDDSSNPVLFSYPLSGAIPAVTAGGNAILVSEGTTNQFVGSVNFVKTLRIQSDGTNWVLID